MSYEIENAVINDPLCFISTSRDSLQRDNIAQIAIAFYKEEIIKQAKEVFFKICSTKSTIRKACKSHPNPSVADVEDILDLFDKKEQKNFLFPKFVAEHHLSLPPQTGFIHMAGIICSFRDELTALREELKEVRKDKEKDVKSLEDISDVKNDISDIKTILMGDRSNANWQNKLFNQRTPIELASTNQSSVDKSQLLVDETMPPSSPSSYLDVVKNSFSVRKKNNSSNQRKENLPLPSAPPVEELDSIQSSSFVHYSSSREVNSLNNKISGQRNIMVRNNGGLLHPSKHQRYGNRSGRRTNNIAGSKKENNEDGITGAQRNLDIFVGGCELNSTVDNIVNHCKISKVNIIKCEALQTKADWYKCYKVTVKASDRDLLLVPEFWSLGIFVRKFMKARVNNNVNI